MSKIATLLRPVKMLLLSLCLLLSAIGISPAHPHRRVSVGVGFSAYFPAPIYGVAGFYYPAYYPVGVYVPAHARPYYAFVDTDIHPEEARVFLDGKLIGTADDFDGYPGYLALKPGRHTLGFAYQGYHSLSFKLDLRPGELADLDRKLPRLEDGEPDPGLPPAPTQSRTGVTQRRGAGTDGSSEREEYGILRLQVFPPGARVILDGSYFGTGAEISRLHRGIPLSPGAHRIRVSLEGYRGEVAEIRIVESEEQSLRIRLKKR